MLKAPKNMMRNTRNSRWAQTLQQAWIRRMNQLFSMSHTLVKPEANALSLEAASVALQGLNEAQVDATIKVQDQDGGTVTGVGKETDAFPVSESVSKGAVKEPTADSVIQTPSSASSIAEDPQLTTVKTAQEITLAELKAKRAALMASLAPLPVVRDLLATSGASSQGSNAEPTEGEILTAAHQINKKHIKLLHEYNEIKDVGQGLMGLIADQRGVRIVDVQDDFGVDAKDWRLRSMTVMGFQRRYGGFTFLTQDTHIFSVAV
jgi:hypothetical protein